MKGRRQHTEDSRQNKQRPRISGTEKAEKQECAMNMGFGATFTWLVF
jgi:hypothetical protein